MRRLLLLAYLTFSYVANPISVPITSCPPGYSNPPKCHTDIDECQDPKIQNKCNNLGLGCLNKIGGYSCIGRNWDGDFYEGREHLWYGYLDYEGSG